MGVVLQHLPADVPRDCHNRLLARLPFCQLRNAGMAKIIEAQTARATTCPISAYALAYNMLPYVLGAVRALA